MELLLDTHIIIWALTDDEHLSQKEKNMISDQDNIIYFSTVSLWEIAVKNYKAPEKCPYNESVIEQLCRTSGYHCIDIKTTHIKALRGLRIKEGRTLSNQDPFDRMLIAQAKTQGIYILSHDSNFQNYDEPCIIM